MLINIQPIKKLSRALKVKNKSGLAIKDIKLLILKNGLIKKTKSTPANIPDFKILKDVCPKKSSVLVGKAYDLLRKRVWEQFHVVLLLIPSTQTNQKPLN